MEKESSDFLDENELEVCEILSNLATLIQESEIEKINNNNNNLNLPFSWGRKKKRSNRYCNAVAVAVDVPSSSPPPPPLPAITTTSFQNDRNVRDKVEAASSPATPLSFSPSESDDKSIRKSSKKRSREELLEMIDGLTQSRTILKGEVENVRSYYNKLKAFNMELKTLKHERLTALENLGMNLNLNQNYRTSIMPHHHQEYQNYPYVGNGFGVANHGGPRGNIIPDLNVSPEEVAFAVDSSQPLDHHHGQGQSQSQSLGDRKAMAAEKRMMRRMINIKKKNEHRSR